MRKLAAECLGTFALLFAGTGAIVIDDVTGGAVSHVGVALTFGLIVLAMIYTIGEVSGAHLNPAVTLGFFAARRFPGRSVLAYVGSQCAGALLASLCLRLLFPGHATLEGQVNGNTFFAVSVRLNTTGFAKPLSEYLTLIDKARKVARRFGVNPTWTFKAFDTDSQATARDLYAIFFDGGLVSKVPNISMTLTCSRRTFQFDVLAQAKGLVPISIATDWVYTLLGEEIAVGTLTHEYTAVRIAEKKSRKKTTRKQRSKGDVELAVTGSQDTVRTIRPGDLPPDS
jgi:hypothetical protein